MKRIAAITLALAAIASLTATLALAHGSPAKLLLHQTKLGKILVNSRGFTVYAFTADKRNKDNCVSISPNCLVAWPPVTTSGKPIAGPGVKQSLLGTIKLGRKTQVTYAGHPLYTYLGDTHPAQTTYVNILQFKGYWPALNAAGKEVK
jgi:predicted lipoprotein with Yx(FWY)xxD motif